LELAKPGSYIFNNSFLYDNEHREDAK